MQIGALMHRDVIRNFLTFFFLENFKNQHKKPERWTRSSEQEHCRNMETAKLSNQPSWV